MDELRFNYIFQDLLHAAMLNSRKRMIVASAAIAIIAACFAISGAQEFAFCLVIAGIPAMLVGSCCVLYFRAYRTFKSVPFQSEVLMHFHDNFFVQNSRAGEGRVQWVHKIKYSSKVLLLFFGPYVYALVPRRVCADDAQYARLIALGQRLASGTRPSSSTPPSAPTERNA